MSLDEEEEVYLKIFHHYYFILRSFDEKWGEGKNLIFMGWAQA